MDHQELVEAVVRAMKEVDSEVSRTLQDEELAFELQILDLTHGYSPFDLAFNSVSATGGDHLKLITSKFEEVHDQLEMVTFGQKQEEVRWPPSYVIQDFRFPYEGLSTRNGDQQVINVNLFLFLADGDRLKLDCVSCTYRQMVVSNAKFPVYVAYSMHAELQLGDGNCLDDRNLEKMMQKLRSMDETILQSASTNETNLSRADARLGQTRDDDLQANRLHPPWELEKEFMVNDPFYKLVSYSFGAPGLDTGFEKLVHNPFPLFRPDPSSMADGEVCGESLLLGFEEYRKESAPQQDSNDRGKGKLVVDEAHYLNPFLHDLVMPVRSRMSGAVSTDDGTAATARAPRSPFMKMPEPKNHGRELVQEDEDDIAKRNWLRSTDMNSNPSTSAARSSTVVNAGVGEQEVCQICFVRTPATSPFFHVEGCAHRFCMTCNARHAETRVRDTGHTHVTCPHYGCPSAFSLNQLQTLLTTQSFEILTTRLIVAAIPERERVWCPYPTCSTFFVRPYSNLTDWVIDAPASSSSHPPAPLSLKFTECLKCHRGFCLECVVPWHTGTCGEYQGNLKNSQLLGDEKLMQLAEEKQWKQCEKCKSLVELSWGCHHITCRCGHNFCYNCGEQWPSNGQTCNCRFGDERRL